MSFTKLEQTPLEKIESIDNLRILENGYKIKAVEIPRGIDGVDTPLDRDKIENLMRQDPLFPKYRR